MEERNSYCGFVEQKHMPGQMIREMRERMQLSQESVSCGICSVQKYSRIESGLDEPSEIEFENLMERLQEPALDYGDLYLPADSRRLSLRASLREAAALGRWERVGELLYVYTGIFPPGTPEEIQFYRFYETIRCYIYDETMSGLRLAELCQSLILLVRPDFRTDIDIDTVLSQSEFLLLNAMAVGLSDTGNPALISRARCLLTQLLTLNSRRDFPSLSCRTQVALLLNLSSVELETGDYDSARKHLSIIFRSGAYYCGSHLLCRALINRYILLSHDDPGSATELGHMLRSLFHINPEKRNDKVLVF